MKNSASFDVKKFGSGQVLQIFFKIGNSVNSKKWNFELARHFIILIYAGCYGKLKKIRFRSPHSDFTITYRCVVNGHYSTNLDSIMR